MGSIRLKRTSNLMVRAAGFFALFAVLMLGVISCSRLAVKSNPPGARVLWSPDGVTPYQAWPPNSLALGGAGKSGVTPFSSYGVVSDTFFITVEKDGYRRPRPKPVSLYSFRRETLDFELTELPETYAARMRAEGKLYYRDAWVIPEEVGVIEYEGVVMPKEKAFRLSQLAKGLVEYRGEWYSKEEAARRLSEDRIAEGFVPFKDRWVKPEVRDYEVAIDNEVKLVRTDKVYPDLPAPKVLGSSPVVDAQIQLYNSTGQKIRFLFSGPMSRSYELEPYKSVGVRMDDRILLPAGRYDIVVVPTGLDASGRNLEEILGREGRSGIALSTVSVWSSWPFAPRTQYSFNFTGLEGDLKESLEKFELPTTGTKIEAPTIEIPEIKKPEPQFPIGEDPDRPRGRRPGGPGGQFGGQPGGGQFGGAQQGGGQFGGQQGGGQFRGQGQQGGEAGGQRPPGQRRRQQPEGQEQQPQQSPAATEGQAPADEKKPESPAATAPATTP